MPQVAYRAVRSRRKFNKSEEIIRDLSASIDSEVKPHFIREFDKRVANWKNKPEFRARKFIRLDSISLNVFPAGPNKEIWGYVDRGTRPHIIRPIRANALAFRTRYVPKTRPPDRYGGLGRASGPRVYTKLVRHPGTKARKHTEGIRRKNRQWYSRTMESAWRRAIRRA